MNISQALYGPNGCVVQEQNCYAAGNSTESNKICHQADDYCVRRTLCIYRCAAYARPSIQLEQINNVFSPAVGNRDADDLRQNSSALFPPEYYVDYLGNPEVMNKIGAESTYQECPDAPYELFVKTGDVCCLGLALQC